MVKMEKMEKMVKKVVLEFKVRTVLKGALVRTVLLVPLVLHAIAAVAARVSANR